MTESKRLEWFTRTLAVAFLLCTAVSGSLWISTRLYPLVPIAPFIAAFPYPLDYALLVVVVALLVGLIIRPRSKALIVALLVGLAVLFLQDQNRLWPSFYEFAFFFFVLAGMRMHAPADEEREASRVLMACRFILAGVYFWS